MLWRKFAPNVKLKKMLTSLIKIKVNLMVIIIFVVNVAMLGQNNIMEKIKTIIN